MALTKRNFKNFASTTLAEHIGTTTTSFTVANGDLLPETGQGYGFDATLVSPSGFKEAIFVGNKDGNELSSITRGVGGSAQGQFCAGSIIQAGITAEFAQELQEHTLRGASVEEPAWHVTESQREELDNLEQTIEDKVLDAISEGFIDDESVESNKTWSSEKIEGIRQTIGKTVGLKVRPTLEYGPDNTLTIMGDGVAAVFDNPTYEGQPFVVNPPQASFNLEPFEVACILIAWNEGSPIYTVCDDDQDISGSDVVSVFRVIFENGAWHTFEFNLLANGLPNKIDRALRRSLGFQRESGLAISSNASRQVLLTAGNIWFGATRKEVLEFSTASGHPLFFLYKQGGEWQRSIVTQYNNTQYQGPNDLQSLSPNRYAVNWLWRGVETQRHMYLVLGTGNFTLTQALDSQVPPDVPPYIPAHAVLVGRIIVEVNTTAANIQSAFDRAFTSSQATTHNSLAGLQGGEVGGYFHSNQQINTANSPTWVNVTSSSPATAAGHVVRKDQSEAFATTAASSAVTAHESALDPHSQYTTTAEASAAAPVQSVQGRTGNVVVDKVDVGLGNVPNVDATNASNILSGTLDTARLTSTASRTSTSTTTLLQAAGMRDHTLSSDHDARYLQRGQNLADIDNADTARLNIGAGVVDSGSVIHSEGLVRYKTLSVNFAAGVGTATVAHGVANAMTNNSILDVKPLVNAAVGDTSANLNRWHYDNTTLTLVRNRTTTSVTMFLTLLYIQ